MKITMQGYHLPRPETKARLYQDDHLTPFPQMGCSTVALYVDGGSAEENLTATKCHMASLWAPAVPNPDADAKLRMTSEAGGGTTVKCYRKNNTAKRVLAASRVGGVVTTRGPIVSPEAELMKKRILADYERNAFSCKVRLRPGQDHPKVHGTERLGVAKLDLYPNAKPKSVKPTRV